MCVFAYINKDGILRRYEEEKVVLARGLRGFDPCFQVWRPEGGCINDASVPIDRDYSKKLSFISNRQRRKEGTFCASELVWIEPTPPAPEEQGMPAFAN